MKRVDRYHVVNLVDAKTVATDGSYTSSRGLTYSTFVWSDLDDLGAAMIEVYRVLGRGVDGVWQSVFTPASTEAIRNPGQRRQSSSTRVIGQPPSWRRLRSDRQFALGWARGIGPYRT